MFNGWVALVSNMGMVDKILVPVDGSEYMMKEMEVACQFSKLLSAEVTILHVVAMPFASEPTGMPEVTKQLEDAGNKILAEAQRMAVGCGIQPRIEKDFSVGNPGMRIIKKAETIGAGMIIIGAKGKDRLREILMGSVANAVVSNAPCLVLVVRLSEKS
jgi:nucleotide-binding universal stress UspA family protein